MTFKRLKYSGLLVMCKKGGLKGREPLKLCIMIAKENGKRENKWPCSPKEYFIIATICQSISCPGLLSVR
jgi:hypothetical protein